MADLEIDAGTAADIAKFEEQLERYLAGELDEDVFRVFRLNNGIYGQRQGGHNQMVRIKAPYGVDHRRPARHAWPTSPTSTRRGWGHLTTRQNVQFHFVQLERVPDVLRDLASVGLTTREACGDTVRNVHGLPPRRRLPLRGARHHALGRGRLPALPAQPHRPAPAPQVQDQLLGLRHRLRPGHVQRRRRDRRHPHPRRRHRRGRLPGLHRRRPRAPTPTRRSPSRSSPPARTCCPPSRRCLRVFEQTGNRDNKLRARMKWLVDTLGFEELQRRIFTDPQVPARLVHLARRHPRRGREARRRARRAWPPTSTPTPMGQGTPVALRRHRRLRALGGRQRRARRRQGHRLGLRLRPPRRHHLRPVPGPRRRSSASSAPRCASPTARTSCSAASPRAARRRSSTASTPSAWPNPGAELVRDVVACPGADTCNLAVTQSRGLADAIGDRARGGGPRRGRRPAHQHLGLHQLLRPAPHRRHRLLRRRAPGPRPVRPRLPDAARRLRRRGEDPLRREGPAPAGQERPRGRRPGRAPVRRRAQRRRDLPGLARPHRRRQGDRRRR